MLSESPLTIRIFPRKQVASDDLARAIGDLAQKERWPLLELHTEEGRLDEVFRGITLARHQNRKGGSEMSAIPWKTFVAAT